LPADLVGRHLVITAGGTREPLDPVRFLGNRSSGRQGYALATVAAARGARVTLVSANVEAPDPAGTDVIRVGSAEQLREATLAAVKDADVIVMAAAVADFRPAEAHRYKIKKADVEPEPVALVRNADILTELVELRRNGALDASVIVGFAAETGDTTGSVLSHGRLKLARKGCDLLVVNVVGDGRAFGQPDNAAMILAANGAEVDIPLAPKAVLASAVCDAVVSRLSS
jgi:phosphopantothenoylcysteine decarboxylase/phosphopantothenate--cysteine ligase